MPAPRKSDKRVGKSLKMPRATLTRVEEYMRERGVDFTEAVLALLEVGLLVSEEREARALQFGRRHGQSIPESSEPRTPAPFNPGPKKR